MILHDRVCLICLGSLLALFTPDAAFSACEVTNDGIGVALGMIRKLFVKKRNYLFFTEMAHLLILLIRPSSKVRSGYPSLQNTVIE